MKKTLHYLLVAVLVLLNGADRVNAQNNSAPPGQISYQGFLTDANGNPLATNSPQNFTVYFKLWNDPLSPTNILWGEQQTVTVDRGFFTVLLGQGSLISGVYYTNNLTGFFNAADASSRFVGITIPAISPNEMAPRLRLLASPYALLAANALNAANAANAINALNSANAANAVNAVNVTGANTITAANLAASIGIWTASGANVFRNTGRVGIGTSGPSNPLTVSGDADFTGKVGIGTAAPVNPLSVTGNADFSGNVGIGGVTAPNRTLDIKAGNDGITFGQQLDNVLSIQTYLDGHWSDRSTYATSANILALQPDGGNVGIGLAGAGNKLSVNGNVDFSGTLGIGVSRATRARLEVGTQAGSWDNTNGFRYFNGGLDLTLNGKGSRTDLSIYAVNAIAGDSIFAFSDARIKNIIGRSDAATDLQTLMRVEITDYTHKDVVAHGNGANKKVIAQQVEKVFPQAVHRTTDVVPDIYTNAVIKDGWVELATDLKTGERVRLITEKGETVHDVLEVRPGAFRTDIKAATEKVFVFGREVNDFRNVDYDAIAMLNVSATQELARQLVAARAELAAVHSENLELTARLSAVETAGEKLRGQVAAMATLDAAREARLNRLEKGLLDRSATTARISFEHR